MNPASENSYIYLWSMIPFLCNMQSMDIQVFKTPQSLTLSCIQTRMKKPITLKAFLLSITNYFLFWVLNQFVYSRMVYRSFQLLPLVQEALDKAKDLFGNDLKNRLVLSALQTSSSEYDQSKAGNHLFHSSTMIESTRALSPDIVWNVILWSFFEFLESSIRCL